MTPGTTGVDDAAVPDRTDVAHLIRLGRDREAAELGAATIQGGDMDALAQLEQLGPVLGGVFGALTPADLDKQTPCDNFTVGGVLEHMVGGATVFTEALGGQPAPGAAGDVLAGIGPAVGGLLDAIGAPGALELTVATPFGEVSGDTLARYLVLDGLVHGWDISTATGWPYDPPAALVSEAQALAREML